MIKITFGASVTCLLMFSFAVGAELKKDSLSKEDKNKSESEPSIKTEKVRGEIKKVIFTNQKIVELGFKDTIVEKNILECNVKRKIKQNHFKNAFVSNNGKYVIFKHTTMEYLVPKDDEEKMQWDGSDASSLDLLDEMALYDASGNLIWGKQFPPNIEVIESVISDSNNIIAAITKCPIPSKIAQEEPLSKIWFFNMKGQLVWSFPRDRKEGFGYFSSLVMSANAKYLNVEGGGDVFFINSKNGRVYKYPGICAVAKIEDNGIAKISIYNEQIKKRTYETIDISKELGD